LKKPVKHPIEQEEMLSYVAQKRMKINKLMAMVDEGVGPILAATVIALCIRLAFSLFTNFSVVLDMFSGKILSFSTVAKIFLRALLECFVLVYLSNAGQSLKNEVVICIFFDLKK
jgi:hypothetical protein